MSRRRNYSDDTIAIMGRFFEALNMCLEQKLLKTINGFCSDYGIDKRHLYAQRKDLGKGFFEVSWLLPLINDCGISSTWLLTGKGLMFDTSVINITLKSPKE